MGAGGWLERAGALNGIDLVGLSQILQPAASPDRRVAVRSLSWTLDRGLSVKGDPQGF
jgi:hypothetical protein